MQQNSLYQANRNQLLMTGATIFVSVTAAVIVSTLLIMSLMRGEIANALTSSIQNSSPTSQVASTCTVPASEEDHATPAHAVVYSAMPTANTASAPFVSAGYYAKHYVPAAASINNSYNSTNTSNTNTTNNVTNTEIHKTTVIKDSFNKDSYNDNSQGSHNVVVVKDNEVNLDSNNTTNTNSGNTITATQTTNTTNNTTSTINTLVDSNNITETHVLSDNNTVIVPIIPVI